MEVCSRRPCGGWVPLCAVRSRTLNPEHPVSTVTSHLVHLEGSKMALNPLDVLQGRHVRVNVDLKTKYTNVTTNRMKHPKIVVRIYRLRERVPA